MSEAERLFGDEHVRRYRETGGEVGHVWKEGSTVLLLTTKGRKTGEQRTTPLIYAKDGDHYVIVASKGGAPDDPGWYRNLAKSPDVELQVKDDVFPARARTADGGERERLWQKANAGWPHYEEDRQPLVDGRLYGAKSALLYTAVVPLALAIGFMLLIAYFFFTGGYKQVHLEEPPRGPSPVRPGAPAEHWGR